MARTYNLYRGGVEKLGHTMTYTGSTAGNKNGGTCLFDCDGCYAQTGNFNFPHVRAGLAKMTDGYRNHLTKVFEDFQDQINRARNPITMIRINYSGDFVSVQHLMFWVNLALNNPSIKMYMYTKRYDFVRMMFDAIGELPDNLYLNISVWGKLGIKEWDEFKHHKNVNCFVVDLDKSVKLVDYDPQVSYKRCPSYDIDGDNLHHPCDECGLCFGKQGDHLEIHVWKH